MKTVWINNPEKFQVIANKWDEALFESCDDNRFLLSFFILIWWKYYAEKREFLIFVVYEKNQIIGGIPLCVEIKNGKRKLVYPGETAANYTEFLSINPKINLLNLLANELVKRSDWDVLCLDRFRTSKLIHNSSKALPSEIRLISYNSSPAYVIDLNKDDILTFSWLPKKLRYYLRKSREGLSNIGNIELVQLTERNEIIRIIDEFYKLGVKSFSSRGKINEFEDEKYKSYFKELLLEYHKNEMLDVNVLYVNDLIIAIHIGYTLTKNLNYVLTTINWEVSELNPGHQLLFELVKLGASRGDQYLDMYTGDVLYKRQWCTEKKSVNKIIIVRDTVMKKVIRNLISFFDHFNFIKRYWYLGKRIKRRLFLK